MDEEISIIDSNTRIEKIKNFFENNKIKIIIIVSTILVLLITYLSLEEVEKVNKIKLANEFNTTLITYNIDEKEKTINKMINIINKKDVTYSPLALYFLIDNNLIEDKLKINTLFDVLIDETNLDKEIKNLIIYKKALNNSDFLNENELIQMLKPILKSESVWKPQALYLIAEYFYSKGEKTKAIDFFKEITKLSNINNDIKLESQKRINRDLGE